MFKAFCFCLFIISTPIIANETVMEIIPVFNRPASELQPLLSPLLEATEQIIATGNNLIIKATPVRLEEFKILLKKLDTRLNNFSITVIQSRTKTAQALNASASFRLNKVHNKPILDGHIRGRFAQTEGFTNSDSTQVIKTLEGRAAYIKTGTNHPIQNINIYDPGYGYPTISTNTEFIETSTGFLVTPRITGHQVTLDITPWSDKINNMGIIETQEANTTLRINLGEWVEIGGITEINQMSRNKSLSHSYSTANKTMRIIIKVDKSN
jgi:type II secretory pathway component GspD/PulD (secretin)